MKSQTAAPSSRTRIYLAGPLFSAAEQAYNVHLAQTLRRRSFEVALPQDIARPIVQAAEDGWQGRLFDLEVQALREADLVVCILDGSDVDSGTAWEVGLAWSLGKRIVGIRSDFRTFGSEGRVNLMVDRACEAIVSDEIGLLAALGVADPEPSAL